MSLRCGHTFCTGMEGRLMQHRFVPTHVYVPNLTAWFDNSTCTVVHSFHRLLEQEMQQLHFGLAGHDNMLSV